MAKKAKKPVKVAKKAKPSQSKPKKPAKVAAKKAAPKASKSSKMVKAVKKVITKLATKAMPKKKTAEKVKPKKSTEKAPVKVAAKAPVKAPPVLKSAKDKKAATPKTLQVKGKLIIEETTSIEVKVENKPVKDIILTDAEGRILCRVKDCDQPAVVEGYCRYHYLFFWKKIQNRKKILSEGKLEQYIEELTSRYPLKFLELIRKDLSSEPDFLSAIQELDIDEASTNVDDFEDENFMEEVRGIGSGDTERVDDEY